MASVFKGGDSIVPVKLEIKQFSDKENTLYVAVALESTKTDEVNTQGNTENGVTKQYAHSSNISIADLFGKINLPDKNFIKYIPNELLNADQLDAKRQALAKEARKYGKAENVNFSLSEVSYDRQDIDTEALRRGRKNTWKDMKKVKKETARIPEGANAPTTLCVTKPFLITLYPKLTKKQPQIEK